MKKILSLIISILILTSNSFVAMAKSGEISFYVSPDGNDNNRGTIEAPLKSLEGAKARILSIRSSNEDSSICVYFRGGEYNFENEVSFEENIPDNSKGKITFKAYSNELPVFTTGVEFNNSVFENVDDEAIQSRIPESARESVKCIDLTTLGVDNLPKFEAWVSGHTNKPSYPTLYWDGNEQILSQWPNEGFTLTGRMLDGGVESTFISRGGNGYDDVGSGKGFTFQYNDEEPGKWSQAKDFFIEGYLRYDYFFGAYNISELNTTYGTISTNQGANGGEALEERRWRARNLIEEIDMVGEYYIDYDNNKLYYYAPSVDSANYKFVYNTNQFISLKNTSNYAFEGITFDSTLSTAVQVYNCKNVTFDKCNFKNIGMRGIEAYYCNDLKILNSNFSVIGGSAIWLRGGDRVNLTPSGNLIDNCTFYKWAQRQRSYEPAVHLHDTGMRITNNTFHNAPFSAILFTGNDNYIAHNEIYNVLDGINDGGAIYLALGPSFRGNEVCYNYVHDLFEGLHGSNSQLVGLYFDDGTSGTKIHHNVVLSAKTGIASSGRDNEIYNNVIDAVNSAVTIDNRGENWQKHQYYNEDGSIARNSRAMSNYFSYNNYKAYSKYPHFMDLTTDPIAMNLTAYNSVYDNIAMHGNYNLCETAIKYGIKIEDNLSVRYDALANTSIGDYSLADNKNGFDPLRVNELIPGANIHRGGSTKTDIWLRPDFVDPNDASVHWTPVDNADKYQVTVFVDEKEYYTTTTTNTFINLTNLEFNKDYTVRVSPLYLGFYDDVNLTICEDRFTTKNTTDYGLAELAGLNNKINSTLINTGVGQNIGQYTSNEGYINRLTELTQFANSLKATKREIDEYITKAKQLDVETQNATNWGYTALSDGAVKNGYSYVLPQCANEVYCFGINAAYHEKPLSFVLRSNVDKYGVESPLFKGYVVDFTRSTFTLSKLERGLKTTLTTLNNSYLNDNRLHQVRIGAVYIPDGIKITIFVDGKKFITYKDKDDPYFDLGYFGICGYGNVSIYEGDLTSLQDPSVNEDPLPYYLDMNELLSNKDNWEGTADFTVENGVLKTPGECDVWTKDVLPQNAIVKFMGKMNLGTGWQGLAVRDSIPNGMPWSCNDYLVCLKPLSVEIQTFNNQKNLYYAVQDAGVDWNDWHEFEIASYDVELGVRVVLKIDGRVYLDYTDESPINNPGHFGIYDFSKLGFEIKAVE